MGLRHHVRDAWHELLHGVSPRIALADGGDERVVAAAIRLAESRLISPVLVGPKGASAAAAARLGVSLGVGVDVVECDIDTDPLWRAMELVNEADALGCVAGAGRPTSDVLRAAIKVVGLEPTVSLVSSGILLMLGDDRVILVADCAVVPVPDAAQLAIIARASARTYTELMGEPARVAMLSFSTLGSADHEAVTPVRTATELVRAQAPDLVVDGELQFDAAFVPEVAARKAPDSVIAGNANVFVFPSLEAGNIAYKMAERIGGVQALGPILQGLQAPIHDLSRGCSIDDVFEIAVIAGVQVCNHLLAE